MKVPYKRLVGGVEFIDAIPKNPSGKMVSGHEISMVTEWALIYGVSFVACFETRRESSRNPQPRQYVPDYERVFYCLSELCIPYYLVL